VKKRRLIIITIISAVLFVCIMFLVIFGNPIILKNRYDFGHAVKNLSTETITLNEITSFEWDIVYSFAPYTPKQEMEKIIGFKSNYITETVSEGMLQLIFVKDNKVVCNILGYSSNLGYSISLWTGAEDYCQIRYEDDISFSVEYEDNVPLLVRN
jgi:hypothetical protein